MKIIQIVSLFFSLYFLMIGLTKIVFADSIQLDDNSINVQTKLISPSPTPTISVESYDPIITKIKNLEDTSVSISLDSLTPEEIFFSPLSATDPLLRKIRINTSSNSKTALLVYADNSLQTDHDIIPATTCDDGACSQSNSSIWTQALTYGFGYRCDSTSYVQCQKFFPDSNSYKQISQNISKADIYSVFPDTRGRESITYFYKINIANTQAKGNYEINLNYLFLPEL